MPSDNYLGNPLLKAAYVNLEYDEDTLKEYVTCSQDPVHFAKNYVKIDTLIEDLYLLICMIIKKRW